MARSKPRRRRGRVVAAIPPRPSCVAAATVVVIAILLPGRDADVTEGYAKTPQGEAVTAEQAATSFEGVAASETRTRDRPAGVLTIDVI